MIPRSSPLCLYIPQLHISLNVFSKDIPGMYGSLRDALNVISEKHTRDTGNSTRVPLSQ